MSGHNIKEYKQKAYKKIPNPEEEKPFLETYHESTSSSIDQTSEDGAYQQPKRPSLRKNFALFWSTCNSHRILTLFFIFNISYIFVNVYWYTGTQRWIKTQKWWCPDLPYSPLVTGIRYERRQTEDYTGYNPFAGEYTQELTDAWNRLKKYENFRVSTEEMIALGEYDEDSVPLSKGGYMGTLRVYHELHCLEWIKMEYANPNVTIDPVYKQKHIDHCVDILLQGTMCRGDVTVQSYELGDDPWVPLISTPWKQPNLCMNWESMETWLSGRQLEVKDGVVEPLIGPDGNLMSQEMMALYAMPH